MRRTGRMAYLDAAAFATYSTMPSEFIDAIEDAAPGWVDAQLELWSAKIDARLAKRYATPFDAPAPIAVRGWLAAIVTFRAYLRRGVDPTDVQMIDVKADADSAWVEIKEAADASEGLFELPLRADTAASGIARGAPFVASEQSPYVGFTVQARTGRQEDANGEGSFG